MCWALTSTRRGWRFRATGAAGRRSRTPLPDEVSRVAALSRRRLPVGRRRGGGVLAPPPHLTRSTYALLPDEVSRVAALSRRRLPVGRRRGGGVLAPPPNLTLLNARIRSVPQASWWRTLGGCCPLAAGAMISRVGASSVPSVPAGQTNEAPDNSRARALPSPYRARAVVLPGVSSPARSHALRIASTRLCANLWKTLGTS